MTDDERASWLICAESPLVFIDRYVQVYDANQKSWIPLRLWPAQVGAVRDMHGQRLVIMLKARQLGCTSIVLGYVLWMMLFEAAATILLFSKRDDEAVDLLDYRLKGMYARLPEWLRCREVVSSNDHEWQLSNGSRAIAFGRIGGDSYTATMAVIDEADLIPHLGSLMVSVKPTTDAGGKLILLSRADKSAPESPFKKIYRAACADDSAWKPLFLPWSARPGRDDAWDAEQKKDIEDRTGSLDDLYEQYPATPDEALAPRSLDKRLPFTWLERCRLDAAPLFTVGRNDDFGPHGAPGIPGLRVWCMPVAKRRYVVGGDPAEGNPNSDDSAIVVLDEDGEQVAEIVGKIEPSALGFAAERVCRWYNNAGFLVERNNHGHAVITWWQGNTHLPLLTGPDGKPGWVQTLPAKTRLYDLAADMFREGQTKVKSFETRMQLASIEGSTLKAPEGTHDDRAVAYVLALAALARPVQAPIILGSVIPPNRGMR